MNKNRVEHTSSDDLTAQVKENASELARSVRDVQESSFKNSPIRLP
jgi:hypothetical protein